MDPRHRVPAMRRDHTNPTTAARSPASINTEPNPQIVASPSRASRHGTNRLTTFTYALALLLATIVPNALAQVSLSATAGTPNAGYTTLKQAFDAINSGTHQGAVTISITGNTTETATASLQASGSGTATYTSVQITPTGGVARSISGSIAGALIELNGADNVTIDGLNTGGNSLTIANTDTTTASTLRLSSDASNNLFRRIDLQGSGATTPAGVVLIDNGTTTGNDNNVWENCSIGPAGSNLPVNGVYATGLASPADHSGNRISNCNIRDYFNAGAISAGIRIETGNTSWTLSNNRLFQTGTRTYTSAFTHRGIWVQSGADHAISGNVIGFASAAGTGTYTMNGSVATRFIAIDLSLDNSAESSVQGNTIDAISLTTTSGASAIPGVFCGIHVNNGRVNVGNAVGNVIGGSSGIDRILITSPSTGALLTAIAIGNGDHLIQNNTLGGLSAVGTTTGASPTVNGISIYQSPTSISIRNNTIGGATAQSLRAGSPTTTGNTGASGVWLNTTTVGDLLIQSNTIQNLASLGAGTNAFVRGVWTVAAPNIGTTLNLSNNVITNLTTNSQLATIPNGSGAAVGINVALGNTPFILGNVISNLARTNAASAAGFVAGIAVGNATSPVIADNRIFGLRNDSTSTSTATPGVAAGVVIRSANTDATLANNMIALGSGQNTSTAFVGIMANHASTPNPIDRIYYNTVHISGAAPGGSGISTFAFHLGDFSTNTRNIQMALRNNIFSNTRTGGTGGHYAIGNNFGATSVASNWNDNTSNNNVLNADPATIGHWAGAQTFEGWRTNSLGDLLSYSNAPITFVDPTADLHIDMGATGTVLESGGVEIPSFPNDIDAQIRPGPAGSVRGGAQAPDIGADEFDGAFIDTVAPSISYMPLGRTNLTGNRALVATITDLIGSPTVGPLVPRVYFRKAALPYASEPCSLTGGTATNSNWSCPITAAAMGGLTTGDVVQYFVIAQDLAGNVRSNPSTGLVATSVNNVTTPPSSPSSYTIAPTYSGNYNVGTGEAFTSITNAGGVFDMINQGVLVGDVTFRITSDLLSETGTFALSETVEDGVGNYTLTITPSDAPRIISGSINGPLIRLVGADRVRIDGSVTQATAGNVIGGDPALRQLTIENSNTGGNVAVIRVFAGIDGARQNRFRNLNLFGASTTISAAVVGFDGTPATQAGMFNADNHIENCALRRALAGITATGAAATPSLGTVISKNDLAGTGTDAILLTAIQVRDDDGADIRLNRIALTPNGANLDSVGILLGADQVGLNVSGAGTASNVNVDSNQISGIVQFATYSAIGIFLAPGPTGSNRIVNNAISGLVSNATNPDTTAGILVNGVAGATTRILNNSVSLAGDRTNATIPSYALGIQGTLTGIEVKNNTLSNAMIASNLSAESYAIGVNGTDFSGLDANHNNYFASGPNAGHFRTDSLQASVGTSLASLAAWQAAVADDLNSLQVDPLHVSTNDLHMQSTSPLLMSGTPIADVTLDFEQQVRSATVPAIGADEVIDVDLQIEKNNNEGQLVNNGTPIYALVVANAGPVRATDATLTDTLPATLTNASWMCVQALSTATCPVPGTGTGNLNVPVTINPGQFLRFDLMATVNGSVGGFVTNTATVTATSVQNDVNGSNNSATDQDPIVGIGLFADGFENSTQANLTVTDADTAMSQ